MATNPMKRKARISFLLGMLITLVITGLIIAFLFMQLTQKVQAEKEAKALIVTAYALNQDVSSGQVITSDMYDPIEVTRTTVPNNAITDISVIENYSLQDKEGNDIYTKTVDKNEGPKMYIKIASKDNQEFEVKVSDTGNYYIEENGNNTYLELNSVPLVAKVTMKANTLLTKELLSKSDNMVQDDVRKQEYNMLVLPIDLVTGDYIDIRFMLPTGQDYIVVSKKEVEVPNIGGTDSLDTIWLNMSEDEILHMSCAIIEAAKINGSKLYATKYTEAGMQKAAQPTYPATEEITTLLQKDPNVLQTAMDEVRKRYSETDASNLRNNYINKVLDQQADQLDSNEQTNMQQSITNTKTTRQQYLDSLAAPVE